MTPIALRCRKRWTARRRAARVVFGVILGTGCGGGVVVDRKVIEGANGIGGEWGHTPLPWARAGRSAGRAIGAGGGVASSNGSPAPASSAGPA